MRYVVSSSFDENEVNRFFESDMVPKIGKAIRTRTGKWYRITDVAWEEDEFDHRPNVRVLLERLH